MLDLIELRESATDPPDSTPIHEKFMPLCERALRSDGTIGIKIIGPGWGSSGYYGREVLERDVPRVFPAGTQMFWNHATASEEMERPEGNLDHLAAVTVSSPFWLDNGPKGAGMYADARPFTGYAETIDEIGEHIGVSIRALGRHTVGEAEGRNGRIINELVQGKSIDYVTVPGAGGAITQIFEAAPGAAKLPAPPIQLFLTEAGRVLSAANENKLKMALEQLTAVLQLLDSGNEAATLYHHRVNEAMSNNDIRRTLEDKLKNRFGGREIYIWPCDWSIQDGWVVFEISTNQDVTYYRLDMTVNDSDIVLADDPPAEVRALTAYVPVSMSEAATLESNTMEDDMDLKGAQDALATSQAELNESKAALEKLQEQLLLREARDFVTEKLTAVTDLPDVTKLRLSRVLVANPPIKEGKVDEVVLQAAIDTAVNEAKAEIAAISGSDGRITGMGEGSPAGGDDAAKVAEAKVRLDAALAGMGYGGQN